MSATFIGLDLAKSVFQVHGVDIHGKVVVTKRLRRDAHDVLEVLDRLCQPVNAGDHQRDRDI